MMKYAPILLLLAVPLLAAPAIAQSPDTATVEGFVVRLGTSNPVTGARIELMSASPEGGVRIVTGTDGAGRYSFSDVPPDTYRLRAFREGYVEGAYGGDRIDDAGAVFSVGPGQRVADVNVRLAPTGSISGFVEDQYGEPLVDAQVSAMEIWFDGSTRILSPVRSATTNDRGEYRLYWLDPGPYVIRVTPKDRAPLEPSDQFMSRIEDGWGTVRFGFISGPDMDTARSHAPTYYPGTTDPGGGAAIDLGSGIEYTGVSMRVTPLPAVTVRGRIVSGRDGPVAGVSIRLIPREEGVGIRPSAEPTVRTDANGEFSISGVVPGPYRIVVREGPTRFFEDSAELPVFGRVNVDVGTSDIENVVVPLASGFTLPGRVTLGPNVVLDGPGNNPRVIVTADQLRYGVSVAPARIAPDGTFEIRSLPPNEFRIEVDGFGDGAYIRNATLGGQPVLNPVLRVDSPPVAPLLLEIANDAGRVSVSVANAAGDPASGIRVALVPEFPLRDRRDMYRDEVSVDGAVLFENVVPGAYKLFAWDRVPEGAWRNPDFIRGYESFGESTTVGSGQAVSAAVRVIDSP